MTRQFKPGQKWNAMLKPRLLALALFAAVGLPAWFVTGQQQADGPGKPLVALTNQWRKDIHKLQDREARRRAISGFYALSGEMSHLVRSLETGLRDQDGEIRFWAAKGLVQVGPSAHSAAPLLIEVLQKDKNPEVRREAAVALGNIFWDGSSPSYAKEGIPALIKAMRHDKDALVRRTACARFRVIGPLGKDAAPHLLKIVEDTADDEMKELALISLGEVTCPACDKIVPDLLRLYEQGDKQSASVKGTVLAVLGKIGARPEKVIPLLIDALTDEKKIDFRIGAAVGVKHLGAHAKDAVPALIAALDVSMIKDPGRAHATRNFVLGAFAKIGPAAKKALPAIRLIAETDRRNRSAAQRAIKAIQKK